MKYVQAYNRMLEMSAKLAATQDADEQDLIQVQLDLLRSKCNKELSQVSGIENALVIFHKLENSHKNLISPEKAP